MRIAELTVRRPVLAVVLSLLIVLVGAVSLSQLQVREYPRIDEPVVTVGTRLTGASSEVIESQVTQPLEDAIAGIDGVEVMTSISRAEQSQISVRFKLDKRPEDAAADVRDRVGRVRAKLPDTADEPVVTKVEADASPTLWLAFSSERGSPLEITDVIHRIVKPRVQTIAGVAEVSVPGERKAAMRVWVDPDRLASFALTVQDVETALRQQNLEVPAGRVEGPAREFTVTAQTDLQTPAHFEAVVLKRTDRGAMVTLKDVARVEVGAVSERNAVRINGKPAVGLGLIRQATANPLEVARAVRQALPRLQEDLPPGIVVQIANDTSVFIEQSIQGVYRTIAEAVVLVALVVFVFLRTIRASIIPLVTIPVSLIGAFALMAAAGFTVNTLTLLALVLAIGLVVDDAIVVLENIHRHVEEGMAPQAAAMKGIREIAFAVLAMTLTLAAVFAPLALTPGRTGRLFAEFALTLAGAVLVSGVVALTLSPMMCSRLLRREHRPPGRLSAAMERGLAWLTRHYGQWLMWSFQGPRAVWFLLMGAVALCLGLLMSLPSELSPMEDRGAVLVSVSAPDGATLAWTQRYMTHIDALAASQAEIERRFVIAGTPSVSQGIAFLGARDWQDRHRSTATIAQDLLPQLAELPGVSAFPITPPSLGQGFRERPLNFVITSSASYAEMLDVAQRLVTAMSQHGGFVQPDIDLRLNKPELLVTVDRQRAADAGVPVELVARTLESLLAGRSVTRFKRDADQYDVIVQADARLRDQPRTLEQFHVRGHGDRMLPLSSLVTVQEAAAPRELNHFNQRRSVSITANLAPGTALGTALETMDTLSASLLPQGYTTELNGISREYRAARGTLGAVFGLALLFIYLVLAAQFESFRDPLVIMLSVPLSMVGALLTLWAAGGTLNVYSQIGLVTLVGLITKHGILIVEFANQLRAQGLSLVAACQQAASQRLRPILMTTAAMVLGAVPLALATGAGAESRRQIGWVIVGGMSVGTLLTLWVVPVVYVTAARLGARYGRGEAPNPL